MLVDKIKPTYRVIHYSNNQNLIFTLQQDKDFQTLKYIPRPTPVIFTLPKPQILCHWHPAPWLACVCTLIEFYQRYSICINIL